MAMTPSNPNQQNPNQMQSEMQRDADSLKKSLEHEKNEAGAALGEARDAATQKISQFASEAKEGAMRQAEGVKRQASESLHTFADAIRDAGGKMDNQSMAARMARDAASGLDRLSDTVKQKNLGDVIQDVRDFGRRHPTTFIAGAVLAGLALGRFVKSSGSSRYDSYGQGGQMARRLGSGYRGRPGAGYGDMGTERDRHLSTSGEYPSSGGGRASAGKTGASDFSSSSAAARPSTGSGKPGSSAGGQYASSAGATPTTSGSSSVGRSGSSGIADQTKDVGSSSSTTRSTSGTGRKE